MRGISGDRPQLGSRGLIAALLAGALVLLLTSQNVWAASYVQGEDLPECMGGGSGLVLSADGTTAATGGDRGGAVSGGGASCIYVDSGGSWSKQAELPAGTTPEAISANGDTLVGDSNGREVVFVRSGEAWSKQATLGEAGSAAISADGNTALVHFSKDLAGVFTRSGETWSESATLAPSRTLRRGCGGSEPAVLSADGDLALLGVPGYDGCNGGVVVFAYTGTTWKRSREILRGNARQDAFGIRIALSENEGNGARNGQRGQRVDVCSQGRKVGQPGSAGERPGRSRRNWLRRRGGRVDWRRKHGAERRRVQLPPREAGRIHAFCEAMG